MSPSPNVIGFFGSPDKTDHRARQVDDADRLAHVEHEDFAAAAPSRPPASTSCAASGIGHEVAHDVGVRDRDRAACRICCLNSGTTEPVEPSTLPKRTVENAC